MPAAFPWDWGSLSGGMHLPQPHDPTAQHRPGLGPEGHLPMPSDLGGALESLESPGTWAGMAGQGGQGRGPFLSGQ